MKILFLDIETATVIEKYADLPEDGKAAWKRKMARSSKIGTLPGQYLNVEEAYEEAPLYAEFSRVVCICTGIVVIDSTLVTDDGKTDGNVIWVKGMIGTEVEILNALSASITKYQPDLLCAHNGKNFDYPFLARRYMANRIAIPPLLNTEGKKPWEVALLDTIDIWKFCDLKYYVSLVSLAYVFGIPSPKDDMDGSQVGAAFHAG